LESVPTCNFCGNSETVLVHELSDYFVHLPDRFFLRRCTRCGLMYLNPRPEEEELSRYYQDDYQVFVHSNERNISALRRWINRYGIRSRVRMIVKAQGKGRLLDVGCASGVFLDEMRKRPGWEVCGLEPGSAAETARQFFGLNVFSGFLPDAHYPSDYFDAVSLWDVLEHIPDPLGYLQEIKRILKPGGTLALRVPDAGSWEAQMLGEYWTGFDAPRHLYGFTAKVLISKLAQCGFGEFEQHFAGTDFTKLFESLGIRFLETNKPDLGRIIRPLSHSVPARLAFTPVMYLLRKSGRTSSLLLLARKMAFSPKP
jgi:SAM-dependent methyltransferase